MSSAAADGLPEPLNRDFSVVMGDLTYHVALSKVCEGRVATTLNISLSKNEGEASPFFMNFDFDSSGAMVRIVVQRVTGQRETRVGLGARSFLPILFGEGEGKYRRVLEQVFEQIAPSERFSFLQLRAALLNQTGASTRLMPADRRLFDLEQSDDVYGRGCFGEHFFSAIKQLDFRVPTKKFVSALLAGNITPTDPRFLLLIPPGLSQADMTFGFRTVPGGYEYVDEGSVPPPEFAIKLSGTFYEIPFFYLSEPGEVELTGLPMSPFPVATAEGFSQRDMVAIKWFVENLLA